jgi:SAM-dependent methyltransferase
VTAPWPRGFERIPDEDWTRQPVESLALKYDTVENHGWYRNLEPTVEEVASVVRDGDVLLDYSAGTGIFLGRLLRRLGERDVRVVAVDASPKFLRLCLEKHGRDERVAFRIIRYLDDEKRLQYVDEVIGPPLSREEVDGVVSTNAVHLYFDLADTLAAWGRVMRPGARAFVQSGNIRNDAARTGEWIIDETVESIHRAAMDIVREDSRWSDYSSALDDAARMTAHEALRRKYFLPVRPLAHYTDALEGAGLCVLRTRAATIEADVGEWYDFLSVYHEGVLGWVGGTVKVEGGPPSDEAVRDRLALLREAMMRVFAGRETFDCCWTYITAEKR